MIVDRDKYCRDCDRSIWGDKSCDVNVADNGYYNLADEKCYCKIVNGVRAEKYPWEGSKPDFVNKKLHLPIFPQDNQDPLRSLLKLDTTMDNSEPEVWAKESYDK